MREVLLSKMLCIALAVIFGSSRVYINSIDLPPKDD
jgi:hypothetical protein